MFIALGIVGYIACIIAFCLWDSRIGMPVEWETKIDNGPTVALGAIFWPIATPIIIVMAFSNYLDRAKEQRIQKEKVKQRLRIAAQKEEEALLKEVEAELANERKSSYHT